MYRKNARLLLGRRPELHVLFARDLLMWAVLYHRQVGGSSKALATVKVREKRWRADCDKAIQLLAQVVELVPKHAVVVRTIAEWIKEDRDIVPIDPELIATKGLAARDPRAQATATVLKHLGKLVPKTHPDREPAVNALATALGVPITRYSFRDHVHRYD